MPVRSQCHQHTSSDTAVGIRRTVFPFHFLSDGMYKLPSRGCTAELHCGTSCSLLWNEMVAFHCSPGSQSGAFSCSSECSTVVLGTVQKQGKWQMQ